MTGEGIDYSNALFLQPDGTSRIGVIWDQTIRDFNREENSQSDELPKPYYGTAFSNGEINRALRSDNPEEIVPSKDENGHGTFLAGIAAGGVNRQNDFTGIATQSEIAVVKLKETKPYLREYFGVLPDVPAYQETDIIYAVDYLIQYARQRKLPLSILIGLGSSNGGHLGQTFLERYLETILANVGIMVSTAAGNEGNERLHYRGTMGEGESSVQVEVNVAQNQEILAIEFWGEQPTTFSIGLVSPQGDRIERIPPRFGTEELLRLPIAKTEIYVAYQLIETYSGDELVFIRLVNPTPGLWKIVVYGNGEKQQTFNMWMPLRQFLRPDTYFLRGEPENTITVPGNAMTVMTMTAYNHLNGSIYAQAGRGYNSRNQVKPDLAAPGVNIMGLGLRNNFVRQTGTSVAAAHSAGMMALFLQWLTDNYDVGILYARQIQSLFLKSAVREQDIEYPNPIWGYGVMNIERAFEGVRVTGAIQGEDGFSILEVGH